MKMILAMLLCEDCTLHTLFLWSKSISRIPLELARLQIWGLHIRGTLLCRSLEFCWALRFWASTSVLSIAVILLRALLFWGNRIAPPKVIALAELPLETGGPLPPEGRMSRLIKRSGSPKAQIEIVEQSNAEWQSLLKLLRAQPPQTLFPQSECKCQLLRRR